MKTSFHSFLIAASILLMFSCNTAEQDQSKKDGQKTDSSVTEQKTTDVQTDMQMFRNIELIEYCLPLPLKEYMESNNGVKAKHTFAHKTKKDNIIAVQGLLREDPSVSLEDYFKNSYTAAEEEGRVIQKKELLKDKNCFYVKGYWANSIYESRFIEICWLRKDEAVTFYSTYDIADTSMWNGYLDEMIAAGSECK